MKRPERLQCIMRVLRHATESVTAQSIAKSLHVSERTVYRDVILLQAIGFPIYGEAGRGYRVASESKPEVVELTVAQLEMLEICLAITGIGEQSEFGFDKLGS